MLNGYVVMLTADCYLLTDDFVMLIAEMLIGEGVVAAP